MYNVRTINEYSQTRYEDKLEKLLDEGYEIKDCRAVSINSLIHFTAILTKNA